jgi:hypothetical protein
VEEPGQRGCTRCHGHRHGLFQLASGRFPSGLGGHQHISHTHTHAHAHTHITTLHIHVHTLRCQLEEQAVPFHIFTTAGPFHICTTEDRSHTRTYIHHTVSWRSRRCHFIFARRRISRGGGWGPHLARSGIVAAERTKRESTRAGHPTRWPIWGVRG